MKEKITTLEKVSFLCSERHSGNTTRLVDAAIQILFAGHTCVVLDHHKMGQDPEMNKYLAKKIIGRLQVEHHIMLNDIDLVKCEYPEITIKPKNIQL